MFEYWIVSTEKLIVLFLRISLLHDNLFVFEYTSPILTSIHLSIRHDSNHCKGDPEIP